MTPAEAAALLTVAASYDSRKPDADTARAWAMVLDDLRFEDCRDVIVAHYKVSREWLMPVDVRTGVRRLREKRINDYGPIELPTDLDPDDTGAYVRALTAMQRAIADGTVTPPPPVNTGRRDVIRELGQAGQAIPDA